MKYSFELRREAETHLFEVALYYENQQSGLGQRFIARVENYFEKIRSNPLQYQLKNPPFREVFIQEFPYLIIYEVIENEIIIYAVFNAHQDPEKKP